MTSGNLIKGLAAGFVAAALLSALMLMKTQRDVVSDLNPIRIINEMTGASIPL